MDDRTEVINRLRQDVTEVYCDVTGDIFLPSGDLDNTSFIRLAAHIKTVLDKSTGDIPSDRTFVRFFHELRNIKPITAFLFHDYVLACKKIIADRVNVSSHAQIVLGGADIINSRFKDRILLMQDFNILNFYTAQNIDDGQWYGIFNSWDIPRERYDELKSLIGNSIKRSWKKKKVLAVITGGSGSGKSTLLRRIAYDFMNSVFNVLWVNNLNNLCQSIDVLNNDYEKSYLILIDDWQFIDLRDAEFFFKLIKNANNINVIIADRNTTNKFYLDFFDEKNIYEFNIVENKQIIEKIIAKYSPWKGITNENTVPIGIYNCPLSLSLFLLTYNTDKLTAESGLSQFKSVVRREIILIAERYKGLALALFYWAQIHKKYRIPITWRAFLKLADYYNGNNVISYYLSPFDSTNPICELLSHYIFLEKFVHPLHLGSKILSFHHELLVDEGLSQIVFDGWKLSNEIKVNILSVLMNNDEMGLATDLYTVYFNYDTVFAELEGGSAIRDYYRVNLNRSKSLVHDLITNRAIKRIYTFAPNIIDEDFWLDKLRYLVNMSNLNLKGMNIVVANLVAKGCNAPCIIRHIKCP